MLGLLTGLVVLTICVRLAFSAGKGGARADLGVHTPLGDWHLARPSLLVVGVGLALFASAFVSRSLVSVPAAHVGAIYDPLRGGIQARELPEGLHLVAPWCQIRFFRVQTQEYTMSSVKKEGAVMGDDSIHCQTNEGLGINLDVTVLYHIDPNDAHALWRGVGEDYNRVLVRPSARNVIQMVVARYSVTDVYGNLRHQIETEFTERMRAAFAEKGIILEAVLLRTVEFSNPEFAQAIVEKQVAQQQINTELQNLRRAQFEKETTIAQARGEAEAIQKRAESLRANPEVVQYEMAQKLAPNVRSLYLPSSFLPVAVPSGQGEKGVK